MKRTVTDDGFELEWARTKGDYSIKGALKSGWSLNMRRGRLVWCTVKYGGATWLWLQMKGKEYVKGTLPKGVVAATQYGKVRS